MNYAKCICAFIKIWDGIFLDVLLYNTGHYATQRNMPQTRLWWHDSIRCSGSQCTVFTALHGRIKEIYTGFVKVCFNWSLHAFSSVLVLWYVLFVAISVQWQCFKSVVTSLMSFTFNCRALLHKVAIPFSTDNSLRHCHTWSKSMNTV